MSPALHFLRQALVICFEMHRVRGSAHSDPLLWGRPCRDVDRGTILSLSQFGEHRTNTNYFPLLRNSKCSAPGPYRWYEILTEEQPVRFLHPAKSHNGNVRCHTLLFRRSATLNAPSICLVCPQTQLIAKKEKKKILFTRDLHQAFRCLPNPVDVYTFSLFTFFYD